MKALPAGESEGYGPNHGLNQPRGEKASRLKLARRDRRDAQSLEHSSEEIAQFREAMKLLGVLPLAALLRELGVVLYNRNILRWRVLTDISDELIDQAMVAARARLTDRWLDTPKVFTPRITAVMQERAEQRATERVALETHFDSPELEG